MRPNPYVIFRGRVTNEVELKKAESGTSYVRLNVAVNEKSGPKDKEEETTTFFNVVCFEKMAEIFSKLKKGDYIRVEGKLEVETYTNKENKASVDLSVFADEIMRSDYVGEEKKK